MQFISVSIAPFLSSFSAPLDSSFLLLYFSISSFILSIYLLLFIIKAQTFFSFSLSNPTPFLYMFFSPFATFHSLSAPFHTVICFVRCRSFRQLAIDFVRPFFPPFKTTTMFLLVFLGCRLL